ncbi:unnamed protein product [Kluyveromyces dobzhanskii CBS 2104]|uniref:WGS project CCBQ000000000 data, contig 00058 n=1 Tax=Kluyveromyces dobzhanskii CBS 2104 TaxID=1427455 RepID=A0A0A8LDP0_9SACH|nr:unnamed protein product [Kluyveromyces dobzhanskii CBS 2104]
MSNNIRVFASSFNCAKVFPFEDADSKESILEQLIPHVSHHDVYILGFQELISIWQGSFSYVCLQYLEDLSKLVLNRINTKNTTFKCVDINCLGAIGIMVFCKEGFEVTNVLKSNVRCGAFYSSLKGATAIRFSILHSGVSDTITCISSHLAANEGLINLEKRIQDYHAIIESLRNEFGEMELSHVIFTGDLNFRLNELFGEIDYRDPDVISELLEKNDELKDVMRSERAFSQFLEAKIEFPPTFKYHTISTDGETITDPLSYNFKRQPSWCDRILYSNTSKNATPILYKSIPRTEVFHFTDHQAVILSINLPHIEVPNTTMELSSSPHSSVSNLSLSCGRMVDYTLGYSGWLYFKHSRLTVVAVAALAVFLWKS